MKTKDQWSTINYPELSKKDNELIRKARRQGFADFFPAFPSASAQAAKTLEAAKKYLAGNGEVLTDLLKGSIKQEKAKKKAVTYAELEKGDRIKHPSWGILKFVRQGGLNWFVFKDEDGEEVTLTNFGTKYKRV